MIWNDLARAGRSAYRPKKPKALKVVRGVGNLSRVPDFYRAYICDAGKKGAKCGAISPINGTTGCDCRSKSKYKAQPVIVAGVRFDSLTEGRRFSKLAFLHGNLVIQDLTVDKKLLRFPLVVNGVNVGTYVADFRYTYEGETIVEDTKGVITPVFRLKAKLLEALYPNVKLVIV